MARVVHFEVHVDDPDRASKFYKELFGWEFVKADGTENYWHIVTGLDGVGINGGMMKRRTMPGGESIVAFVCTVEVKSIDETVGKAVAAGGKLVIEKVSVPGQGVVAYCKDPDRNVFGLREAQQTQGPGPAASIQNTHE